MWFAAMVAAQTLPSSLAPQSAPPLDYVCPMHKDVRSATPGKCPRCGMTLVPGLPDLVEYPLDLSLTPRAPKPGDPVDLAFKIRDPKTGAPVTRFEAVHEKLFHMFLVSQDLEFFLHDHPTNVSRRDLSLSGAACPNRACIGFLRTITRPVEHRN